MYVFPGSGMLYTFGEDEMGKLGLSGSQLNDTTRPQPVATLDEGDKYSQVSCGAGHTVAITKKGKCYSWGDGSHGQLGHGTRVQEVSCPKQIDSLSSARVTGVSCGDSHTAVATGAVIFFDHTFQKVETLSFFMLTRYRYYSKLLLLVILVANVLLPTVQNQRQ